MQFRISLLDWPLLHGCYNHHVGYLNNDSDGIVMSKNLYYQFGTFTTVAEIWYLKDKFVCQDWVCLGRSWWGFTCWDTNWKWDIYLVSWQEVSNWLEHLHLWLVLRMAHKESAFWCSWICDWDLCVISGCSKGCTSANLHIANGDCGNGDYRHFPKCYCQWSKPCRLLG